MSKTTQMMSEDASVEEGSVQAEKRVHRPKPDKEAALNRSIKQSLRLFV